MYVGNCHFKSDNPHLLGGAAREGGGEGWGKQLIGALIDGDLQLPNQLKSENLPLF